jgi:hypothetical protein
MKIDGYKIISELFFEKRPDEKIIKTFPLVSIEVYKKSNLETKKRLTARISITTKNIVIDHLSSLSILPVPQQVRSPRKFSISDILYSYKRVDALTIPYEFLSGVHYDSDIKSLVIETLMDNTTIYIKSLNIVKISNQVMNILSKIVKKYHHLKVT